MLLPCHAVISYASFLNALGQWHVSASPLRTFLLCSVSVLIGPCHSHFAFWVSVSFIIKVPIPEKPLSLRTNTQTLTGDPRVLALINLERYTAQVSSPNIWAFSSSTTESSSVVLPISWIHAVWVWRLLVCGGTGVDIVCLAIMCDCLPSCGEVPTVLHEKGLCYWKRLSLKYLKIL